MKEHCGGVDDRVLRGTSREKVDNKKCIGRKEYEMRAELRDMSAPTVDKFKRGIKC